MQNFKTILLSLAILFSSLGQASIAVNLKNGSLILSDSETLRFNWNVQRTYRSRSLFRGFFGQGWCSNLDTRLRFVSPGELQVLDCHQPSPLVYKLDALASFYINIQDPQDKIKMGLGFYERINQKMKFDIKGRLLQIQIKPQDIWIFDYNTRGLISRITNQKNESTAVKWHPILDLVEKLGSTQYHYSGFLLMKVSLTNKGAVKLYDYDDLDNLTNRRENSSHLLIEYYKSEDRVYKIKSSCTQTFQYESMNERVTASKVTQSCPDKTTWKKSFVANTRAETGDQL